MRGVGSDFSGFKCIRARVPDDLEMTQFLGSNVHKKVFAFGIIAVQTLGRHSLENPLLEYRNDRFDSLSESSSALRNETRKLTAF